MKEKIQDILDYIDELFPNARCELNYNKDYELAIAVMLSAQTTDIAVNKVTESLFNKYKTIDEFYYASVDEIEKIIRPIGLSKNKATNIKGFINKLKVEYNSKLPSEKNILMTFPGIGNKSAGVIRAEVFKIQDLAVDTHILRISKRLGICEKNDGPFKAEQILKRLIPEGRWIKSHHQIIFFGRYFCCAKNPKCNECKIKKYCKNVVK